ncbi:tRNA (adenosine(37)-N6)-threonylcarbamoyltransferase complex transferase subunit TsaD [bacterium]|nr:tRNA (adenosine(37)-N6)-threonylcarbamoyltransferase complex transferase subunit TsaD [bacterium]
MIVLGIETSCDDTSAAVFNGKDLLSNVISSQLIHNRFGGVVPELASRSHIQMVLPVVRQAMSEAGVKQSDVEGIAVTYGPGLAGSLLVGLSVAKGLALSIGCPLIGVNHLEGHIFSNRLVYPDLKPPFVTLLVSGGHTQLIHVPRWGTYHIMGRTRDDAAGEAFDKVAKLLGLGYPGGPKIEQAARAGNEKYTRFPRAFLDKDRFDFSFSGLKTSVMLHVRKMEQADVEKNTPNICASFQKAVTDVLVKKTISAAQAAGVDQITMAGGVAVNGALQEQMRIEASSRKMSLYVPTPSFCTDNGAMVACAGHYYLSAGHNSPLCLAPQPSLNFS